MQNLFKISDNLIFFHPFQSLFCSGNCLVRTSILWLKLKCSLTSTAPMIKIDLNFFHLYTSSSRILCQNTRDIKQLFWPIKKAHAVFIAAIYEPLTHYRANTDFIHESKSNQAGIRMVPMINQMQLTTWLPRLSARTGA